MGAALFGKQLEADSSDTKTISDVCSHSIGVSALDELTLKKYNHILIKRNTTLPAAKTLPFRTASENQEKIDLSVTEGEFKELCDVRIISEAEILLPPNLPKGTRVEVELRLDTSQLVHLWLRIPAVSYETEFKFNRISNLSDQEIEKLTGLIADYNVS